MDRFSVWWQGLPRRNQMLTFTLGGIAAGVLLIATGIGLIQFAGAVLIGFALLVARAGSRFPEESWQDPWRHYHLLFRPVQERAPGWLWPLIVAVIVVVLGVALLGSLLMRDGLTGSTLGNLGKGAIALVMIATLALWNTDRFDLREFVSSLRKRPATTRETPPAG